MATAFHKPSQSQFPLTTSANPVPEPRFGTIPKILAIMDEKEGRRLLIRLFASEGYDVHLVGNETSGLELLRKMTPSVLVVDLRSPDASGRKLCQTIMQAAPALPIIVLSAKAKVRDKVMLLEMGACDCLTKPFSPKELLARVRAAMRRSVPVNAEDLFTFDDVTISLSRMELRRAGEPVWLTAQEFKTLKFMIENPERVISREELLQKAWGYRNYPATRTVDNHMLKLRQKLEKDPTDPVHFRTVHSAGYKFIP